MNANELLEQIKFAVEAINKNNQMKDTKVHALVQMKSQRIMLNVTDIGFNDKAGIIYIEVE